VRNQAYAFPARWRGAGAGQGGPMIAAFKDNIARISTPADGMPGFV
jgi:hypothetical protein